MKSLVCVVLVFTIVVSGLLVFSNCSSVVYASTDVNGMISSDTTWTKANSPYTFTGNVFVNNMLTIEPGVTVNLGEYELIVNRTLRAQGTDAEKIRFNGGQIQFYGYDPWNETTGSGNIIENAVFTSTRRILASGCKINNNYVDSDIYVSYGQSIITNNTITDDVYLSSSSAVVSNNIINNGITVTRSGVVSNNTIRGQSRVVVGASGVVFMFNKIGTIIDYGNATSFINNTISKIDVWNSPVITNNLITYTIVVNHGFSLITNNTFTGTTGIDLRESYLRDANTTITGNIFSGCTVTGINAENNATIKNNLFINNKKGIVISTSGSVIIEKNLIINNQHGIVGGSANTKIRYNIITQNDVGIDSGASVIIYNSIENNTQYDFSLEHTRHDVNVSYNWWGTTDQQAINQTIYDFKYTFTTGTVTFIPFLTEPNPETMTISIHNFYVDQDVPEFASWFVLPLLLVVCVVVVLFRKNIHEKC